MDLRSVVKNIETMEIPLGTSHSSSITDLSGFEELIESIDSVKLDCAPGVSHSSAIINIDLFEDVISAL